MNDMLGQSSIAAVARPALPIHVGIFMPGGKILGDETFRLVSFQGQESIGDLFEYNLELHGNTDPGAGERLVFRTLLGRSVTVGIELPAKSSEPDLFSRALTGEAPGQLALFNGIVTSFSMEQPGVYRLGMRPALWKLSLVNGYRHFSGKTIREVVRETLNRYGVEHVFRDDVEPAADLSLTHTQDWLQAGESDLELVRRLLGKAHLFYFFEHRGDGHTMIITGGDNAYSQAYPDGRPLRYTWSSSDELGMEQDDVLLQYAYQETLTSSHVEGTYVRQQAAWEVDGVARFQPHPAESSAGDLPFNQYKVFQYGLSGQEAEHLAKKAETALKASRSQLSGSSRCPLLNPGKLFRVSGATMADSHPIPVAPSLEGSQFVATMVKHQASLDGGYQNEFQAVPRAPVLGFSLQDTQQGTVLAKVLSGEPRDWRYYSRDVFELDKDVEIDTQADQPQLDAKGVMVELATGAKCWARVPSSMQTIPEVGATVLVSRANDESELPEIANIVSADGSMVITPSGWTAHTSVGNSYSTSWGDGKSIRCGAATPDVLDEARNIVEQAYASGEYKESSYSRGGGYSYSTSENGRSGLLSRSESYGNTYNTQKADETKSWSDVGYSYGESKVGDSYNTSTTGTSTSIGTTGTSTSTSLTGSNSNKSAIGMQSEMSAIGTQSNLSMIGMQQTANLIGVSLSANLAGQSDSVTLTGISNSVAATGMQTNANLTGVSSGINLTGVADSVNLTGSSTSTNLTGSSVNTNLTGESTNITISGTSTEVSVAGETNKINVIAGPVNTIDINALGPTMKIDLDGDFIMELDPAVIKIHLPGIEIQIDDGIELHL